MSRNKLRDIFSNDPNAADVKRLEELHKQACEEKWCCTCESYIPIDPYLPGFVTDFPECKHGGRAINTCEKYQRKEQQHEQE